MLLCLRQHPESSEERDRHILLSWLYLCLQVHRLTLFLSDLARLLKSYHVVQAATYLR